MKKKLPLLGNKTSKRTVIIWMNTGYTHNKINTEKNFIRKSKAHRKKKTAEAQALDDVLIKRSCLTLRKSSLKRADACEIRSMVWVRERLRAVARMVENKRGGTEREKMNDMMWKTNMVQNITERVFRNTNNVIKARTNTNICFNSPRAYEHLL